MDALNKKIRIVHNAVNVIGMTFAVALLFNVVCNLSIHWTLIALSSSMVFMILLVVDYNSKSIFTYIVIFGVVICGLIGRRLSKIDVLKYINRLVHWFINYQATKENYQMVYAFIIIFIFIVVVTIFCYIINKNGILRYSIVLGLIALLIYCTVKQIEVNKITLAIFLIYIVQTAVDFCNKTYNNKHQDHKIANIYMLPLCIIIGGVAVCLPSQSQPIEWKTVKQFVGFISDKFDDVSFYLSNLNGESFEEFGINFAGYSDKEGELLGGSINESNRTILKVSPVWETNSSIYLIGSISDEYNDNRWKKSSIDYRTEEEPTVDFYEMLYGFYGGQVVPKETEVLFHDVKMYVAYQKIKTKTIFYPLKTFEIKPSEEKFSYDSSSPSLVSPKILKKNFSYAAIYYELNYSSQTVQNYLRQISKVNVSKKGAITKQNFNQEEYISYLKNVLKLNYFDETFLIKDFQTVLDHRSDIIKKHYTNVPETLPKRVYDLAQDITANYDNNYDKLKAIEKYLSTFKYTLSPSKTKEGEEFVDYFLFEQKEGYCTYFATSMAVLARCVDIPTRYVKGVLLNQDTKVEREYFVTNNSAHAWVEAYIEGFGWVPFEPTPKMYGDRYSQWAERYIPQNESELIPIMDDLEQDEMDLDKEENRIQIEKSQRSKYMVRLYSIIITTIIILLIGAIAVLNYNKKRKYRTASREEKARVLVNDIINYLKIEGNVMLLGETLADYTVRLGKRYDFEHNSLGEVFLIYTRVRYGGKKVEEIELANIALYREELKQHMLKKFGWTYILKNRFNLPVR